MLTPSNFERLSGIIMLLDPEFEEDHEVITFTLDQLLQATEVFCHPTEFMFFKKAMLALHKLDDKVLGYNYIDILQKYTYPEEEEEETKEDSNGNDLFEGSRG